MDKVSSKQNAVFKELVSSLSDNSSKMAIAHGATVIKDLIKIQQPRTLIVRESFDLASSPLVTSIVQTRFPGPVTRLTFSDALFDELDPFGVPDLIAAFEKPTCPAWNPAETTTEPLLLLATQNPSNLGACLRSAAAFGFKNVVTLKEAASPFHSKVIRSSMGAVFSLDIKRGPSIKDLSSLNVPIIALDLHGESIRNFQFPANPIFLVGEEGAGIPTQNGFTQLTIPMSPGIDSLNAAVSCSILLYEWSSRKTGIS
jgi:RNA methyltransferase, TrmH family